MTGLARKIIVGELLKGHFVKRITVDVLVAIRDGKAGRAAQVLYERAVGWKTGIGTVGALLTLVIQQLADAGQFGEAGPYVVAVWGALFAGLVHPAGLVAARPGRGTVFERPTPVGRAGQATGWAPTLQRAVIFLKMGYARHIENHINPACNEILHGAVTYLLNKQDYRELRRERMQRSLPWEVASLRSDVVWLSELVQQTRNQLAVGLNFPGSRDFDTALVIAARCVVEAF